MHRTLQAIKFYARFAGTITRTTGWAIGVVARNAVRGLGDRISGRKDEEAERKAKEWVIGYEPAGPGRATIGFIATRWDEAPKVAIATTYFAMKVSRIEATREAMQTMSDGQLAFVLEQALRANLQVDDLGQFAAFLATFLGRDKILSEGLAEGHSGFVITLKMKGGKYRLRVSHVGPEHVVLRLMNEVDNMTFDYGHDHIPEQLMYAFDFRPEDERITGKLEVRDGVATLEGRSITLAKDGWLGTSELAPLPGSFPAPERQKVRRHPASVLD